MNYSWLLFWFLINYSIFVFKYINEPRSQFKFSLKDIPGYLGFIGFVGYVFFLATVGSAAIYEIASWSDSEKEVLIITFFTVPLGVWFGRKLVFRQLKNESKNIKKADLLFDIFFYPLVSFLFSLIVVGIYIFVKNRLLI